jgi:hypothetical protein
MRQQPHAWMHVGSPAHSSRQVVSHVPPLDDDVAELAPPAPVVVEVELAVVPVVLPLVVAWTQPACARARIVIAMVRIRASWHASWTTNRPANERTPAGNNR